MASPKQRHTQLQDGETLSTASQSKVQVVRHGATALMRWADFVASVWADAAGGAGAVAAVEAEATLDLTGVLSADGNVMATEAGTGITGGTGTVYVSGVERVGGLIRTTILIDLTGLNSQAADGDIIGVDATANPCHIGQITAARSGTVIGGKITCLETPAGGDPNVDLYSATEGTGVEDGAIADLTETALLDAATDWAAGDTRFLTAFPAADEYLYLTQGDATGTDGTYTAGRFQIELLGY